MMDEKKIDWFDIVKRLKAISQAGKFFAKNEYERNRHEDIEHITAEILAGHGQLDTEKTLYLLQEDTGYPTPKVDCRGVIFRDNKVLLVKEIADGGWTFPGGWCDMGLTASENVVREVWEESGFKVKAVKLLAVYDRDTQGHTPPYPFSIYKLFFLCEIIGGEAKTSNETSEVAFFGENEIPPLSPGRTSEKQIKLFFDYYRNPNRPTDFD
jgi:ADP-ribose pyrophosphatase YjhB (NUDIX family)